MMLFIKILFFCIFSILTTRASAKGVDWAGIGQEELREALKNKPNTNVAKNLILFIGDGMGVSTVSAARIYKGQLAGNPGEETVLTWEKFPGLGLSKVYQVDSQSPGSSSTATAILSGEKTMYNTLGLNQNVRFNDCSSAEGNEVKTLADWAAEAGKSAGVITTSRLTHATPAALYAHSASRNWENDGKLPDDAKGKCEDIASQMVKNDILQVFMGGGRSQYLPDTMRDPEYPEKTGIRKDRRNLIQEWENALKEKGRSYKYTWKKSEFDQVDPMTTDNLLGIFEPNHMKYEDERKNDKAGEPSLAEMTQKAINILKKNCKGFFLLVEGARIDHGHHDTLARKALSDTLAFEKAVEKALEMTDQDETLIVVTADHSHPFTLSGYTARGNDILGFVDERAFNEEPSLDGMPYLTISYANGPNTPLNTSRQNLTGLTQEQLRDFNFMQPAAVPLAWETHSSEDVAIYAQGPMAHLFYRTHEQHYIAHVMSYAACIGQNKGHCKNQQPPDTCSGSMRSAMDYTVHVFLGFCITVLERIVF